MHKVEVFLVQAISLIPSGLGSGNHVSGDISDGLVIQAPSESRHSVLSIGDLSDDSLFVSASSKVLLKGFLFKGLFRHDHILSPRVASSAVSIEHLFTVSDISGKGRLHSHSESDSSSCGSLSKVGLVKSKGGSRGDKSGWLNETNRDLLWDDGFISLP